MTKRAGTTSTSFGWPELEAEKHAALAGGRGTDHASWSGAGSYVLKAERPSSPEIDMSEVAYTSRVEIRRLGGPTRSATLPAESEPVLFGAHGEIAEHYGLDVTKFEPHATTIDYVIAAAGG